MPADLLYLTSDLWSSSGTELIADLLACPIAQRKGEGECVLLNLVFTELLDTWYRYSMLVGGLVNSVTALCTAAAAH